MTLIRGEACFPVQSHYLEFLLIILILKCFDININIYDRIKAYIVLYLESGRREICLETGRVCRELFLSLACLESVTFEAADTYAGCSIGMSEGQPSLRTRSLHLQPGSSGRFPLLLVLQQVFHFYFVMAAGPAAGVHKFMASCGIKIYSLP